MSDEPPQASPANDPVQPDSSAAPADPVAPVADAQPAAAADAQIAPALDAAAATPATEAIAAVAAASASEPAPGDAAPAADAAAMESELDQATIDALLKQASFEDPTSAGAAAIAGDAGAAPLPTGDAFELPNFNQVMADAQISSIDLLRDVELNVKIELGRSRMLVEDVLKLGEGSVVELDKLAGDPVDVFVNDRLVARGEVLVLNENFCVRVNEIVAAIKDEGQ